MRVKPLLWACTSTILFTGCATTTHLKKGEGFAINEKATVVSQGNQSLVVRKAWIESDSLNVLEYGTGLKVRLSLAETKKIVVFSRAMGALQGLGLGPVIGFLVGVPLGVVMTPKSCFEQMFCTTDAGTNGLIGGIALAFYGLGIGPVVGAIKGRSQVYYFDSLGSSRTSQDVFSTQFNEIPDSNLPESNDIENGAPDSGLNEVTEIGRQTHEDKMESLIQFQSKAEDSIRTSHTRKKVYGGFELSGGVYSSGNKGTGLTGFFALGQSINTHWQTGIKYGISWYSYEFLFDNPIFQELKLEFYRFPKVEGPFFKTSVGSAYYRQYEWVGTDPVLVSSVGLSVSAAQGYAFWLGGSKNLLLQSEGILGVFGEGAKDFTIKLTAGFFLF